MATGGGVITTYAVGHRKAAPEISGTDLDGKPLDLAQFKGQVIVLNFWASWCPPCRAEAPALQAVSSETKSLGVQFVGVDVDVLLELPDHVVLLPSHYGGSVCGRGLSGNPFSAIGFERAHNPMLALDDPNAFADALLADMPPRPADQERIVAVNRSGATVAA